MTVVFEYVYRAIGLYMIATIVVSCASLMPSERSDVVDAAKRAEQQRLQDERRRHAEEVLRRFREQYPDPAPEETPRMPPKRIIWEL